MTSEQKELLSLLQYFSDFCENHGLRYYLVGGTLLGAVRHKGFIPWDDDIDVAMPKKDYEKFLGLRTLLKEGLVLLEENTCSDYPFYFCELCNANVPFFHGNKNGPVGVYIDIFTIEPSRKPDKLSKFCFDVISVIGYVLQVKTGWTKYIPYKKLFAKMEKDGDERK